MPCVQAGLLSHCPETPAWIRALGSHHALPQSGGEPESTVLEEADPALAFLCPVRALLIYVDHTWSFRSSEQLSLQRSAERESSLQAEVGPLDSGFHHLVVPISRRAVPPEGEGSPHSECCLLLCIGARRLSGRHL